MVISVLAVAFLILVGFIAIVGYKMVVRKGLSPEDIDMEKCSICREKFKKEALLLRQIGDYKLLYFCRNCVVKLYTDLGLKN